MVDGGQLLLHFLGEEGTFFSAYFTRSILFFKSSFSDVVGRWFQVGVGSECGGNCFCNGFVALLKLEYVKGQLIYYRAQSITNADG